MASARLSGLLALEIPAMWCPPEDRPRDPRSHPADETRRQGPALYGLVILRHARRRLVSASVTNNPTAEWIVGQVTDAFPWDQAPRHLIRDRDGAFGRAYTRRIGAMRIRDHPTAPRSPWQKGHTCSLIPLFNTISTSRFPPVFPVAVGLSVKRPRPAPRDGSAFHEAGHTEVTFSASAPQPQVA